MDKLTSMRVFSSVARLGNFAAAARELSISRAMATKHVMYLEDHLKVQLLNRTTRRMHLTEAGQAYLERCRHILDEIEETEMSVTQLNSEPRGTLKLSSPPAFGKIHLTPLISAYVRQYPSVKFDLILTDQSVDIIEWGVDLAFHLGRLQDSNMIIKRVLTTKMIVCAAPKYLQQHGTPTSPAQLKQHNCLSNPNLPPYQIWKFTENDSEVSTRPEGSLQCNSPDALRTAAIGGLGLIMMPAYTIAADLQEKKLLPVLSEHSSESIDMYAIYPHRRHLSAKVRTFLDFVEQHFMQQNN